MSSDAPQHPSAVSVRDVIVSPRRWALWSQRPRVVAYCLTSATAALIVTIAQLHTAPVTGTDMAMLAALAFLAILQAELGRQVERIRRRVAHTPHINMSSVGTFAGVLLLPPALTAVLTVVLYTHLAARSWYRLHRVPTWRTANNACLIVLTCHAATTPLSVTGIHDMPGAISAGWPGAAVLAATAATYFVSNALLVLPARDTIGRTLRELFGSGADNALEAATLCLGVLNALALATLPGLALFVLPPLLMLHRTVLVKQLEAAATRDAKTGLFNTTGWHDLAEQALTKAERFRTSFGVLMVDLDHFKRVNDTYGHLAGDAVLHAVATAITGEVRNREDAVGRFGGEEFVVLLPDITGDDLANVAERIRRAIGTLAIEIPTRKTTDVIAGLSASIGTALYPTAGTALQRLLDAADTALYQAKNTGRNKVVHNTDIA